jgi:hypothetical protein
MFAYVQVLPGFSAEDYNALVSALDRGGPWPGLIVHLAGPCHDGWRIIQAWEDRSAFHQFVAQHLESALIESGAMSRGSGPPVYEPLLITHLVIGDEERHE